MPTPTPQLELPPKAGEKKVKMTCYLEPAFVKALQHESIERDMSLGELVEEAFRARPSATWK